MAQVSVYNMEGKEVGKMDLLDDIFGIEVNEHLVHMTGSFLSPGLCTAA